MNYKTITTFIIVFILYVLLSRGFIGVTSYGSFDDITDPVLRSSFESSQERARYSQMLSFVTQGKLSIDDVKDFAKPDLAWINNHYYPAYPPGLSILLSPFFAIGHLLNAPMVFVNLANALLTLLTGYLLYRVSKRIGFSYDESLLIGVIYTASTLVLSYGTTLYQHTLSGLLLFVILYLHLVNSNASSSWFLLLLQGLLVSAAYLVDYPNIVPALVIFIATCITKLHYSEDAVKLYITVRSNLLWLFLGLLVGFILIGLINYSLFGQAFILTNRYNLRVLDLHNITYTYESLNSSMFSEVVYAEKFNIHNLFRGIHILLFSVDRGLFIYTPILLLLAFTIKRFGNPNLRNLLLLTFFSNLLLYSMYDDPWGGWAFGPRYLIPTLPMLVLLLAPLLRVGIPKKVLYLFILPFMSIIPLLGATTSNLVPPSIEQNLTIPSSFLTNIEYLRSGYTGSFVFNHLFRDYMSLTWYFLLVLSFPFILYVLLYFFQRKHTP